MSLKELLITTVFIAILAICLSDKPSREALWGQLSVAEKLSVRPLLTDKFSVKDLLTNKLSVRSLLTGKLSVKGLLTDNFSDHFLLTNCQLVSF